MSKAESEKPEIYVLELGIFIEAVKAEQLPGKMPDDVWEKIEKSSNLRKEIELLVNATVAVTKNSIADRIVKTVRSQGENVGAATKH